jgi:hypothetical protein
MALSNPFSVTGTGLSDIRKEAMEANAMTSFYFTIEKYDPISPTLFTLHWISP